MATGLSEPARGWVRRLRLAARGRAYDLLGRLLDTDEGRRMVFDLVRGFAPPPALTLPGRPYPLDCGAAQPGAAASPPPVFITARFRSGSTLLWDIPADSRRHRLLRAAQWPPLVRCPGPRQAHRPDARRRRQLLARDQGLEALAAWFHDTWMTRRLFMPPSFPDADMDAYLRHLVERAAGRPVLQFNHVDFRLPWLMHRFPSARLIHLYRHPRDQWLSTLPGPERVPRDVSVAGFRNLDRYYLVAWARDLSFQFPFLDPRHETRPYRLF